MQSVDDGKLICKMWGYAPIGVTCFIHLIHDLIITTLMQLSLRILGVQWVLKDGSFCDFYS